MMHTTLKTWALALCAWAVLPCAAPAEEEPETDTPTEEQAPEQGKKDKKDKQEKQKQGPAYKICKTEKEAFALAKKHDMLVWVVYSDPATCPYCVAFEKKILRSAVLKKVKGCVVCWISRKPLPQYKCTGKPSGALIKPDGTYYLPMFYVSSKSVREYAKDLENYTKAYRNQKNDGPDTTDSGLIIPRGSKTGTPVQTITPN